MAKLNKNHNEYDRLSYSHLDNNEAFGYYYKLQKPLYKLDINSVSGETLTLSAGAAGTTGVVPVANTAAILNADGSSMGYYNSASDKDSSFAIASGTALVTEVKFNKVFDKATILSALANGEFAIDYVNGVIYYKKFDASTSVTCNYKYWDSSISFSGTIGDVTSNSQNIATESTVGDILDALTLDEKAYDTIELTYVAPGNNGAGEVETVVYKDGLDTIYTLTLTYNSDNKLISVTRS